MGLYEFVVRSTYFGQNCINRWNYLSSGSAGSALPSFALAQAMGAAITAGEFVDDSVLGQWQDLVHSGVTFVSLQAKNVYDPTDFYEVFFPSGVVGIQTGDGMAPFNAFGFVSNQVRLDIAKGHKRFAGVAESLVDSGGAIHSASLVGFNNWATEMSNILPYTEDGASLNFAPTVVSKEKYESNPVKHLFSYRYYATEAEQLDHVASPVTWGVMLDVRSQVSRQYGRGV